MLEHMIATMIRPFLITAICLLCAGPVLAQHNLGLLYGRGQGVKQDYAEAYIWESLAATFGNQDAIKNRDVLLAKLSEEELKAAQRRESFLYLKIEHQKSE